MKDAKSSNANPAAGKVSQSPAPSGSGADLPDEGTHFPDEMIAVLAYLHAERRGFAPGHELADWLQAEAELKRRFAQES